MIPRPILATLVFALPLLIVAFAVLMAGGTLAQAMGDTGGALVLRWIALGLLMLTAVDLVLLVGVLGIRALDDREDNSDPGEG